MAHDAEHDPFESAFLHAYPNPERIGCPGDEITKKIAQKKLPVDHPALEHIAHCSPCFRDIRIFQAERARSRAIVRMAVAAAVVAIVTAGLMYVALRPPWKTNPETVTHVERSRPAQGAPEQARQNAVLNFETLSRERGVSERATQPLELQRIPRGLLSLSMYLPKGSEPGEYQVALLKSKSDETPLAAASGTARIENGLTVLVISIDCSQVEAGTYMIAFRHDSESWRYAAIAVS